MACILTYFDHFCVLCTDLSFVVIHSKCQCQWLYLPLVDTMHVCLCLKNLSTQIISLSAFWKSTPYSSHIYFFPLLFDRWSDSCMNFHVRKERCGVFILISFFRNFTAYLVALHLSIRPYNIEAIKIQKKTVKEAWVLSSSIHT